MIDFDNSMPAVPIVPWDTNIEAALRLFPKTGQIKSELVAAHVANPAGLTDFEAGTLIGRLPTTAGATRIGLNKRQDHGIEWFEATTLRRVSRPPAPNTAVVWTFTKEARKLVSAT